MLLSQEIDSNQEQYSRLKEGDNIHLLVIGISSFILLTRHVRSRSEDNATLQTCIALAGPLLKRALLAEGEWSHSLEMVDFSACTEPLKFRLFFRST